MALTPFSKSQLLPQEEKLEISKQRSDLFIGIPKESSYQERRICLTPDAVNTLVSEGHRVMIESGAGLSASYTDQEFSDAGAEITAINYEVENYSELRSSIKKFSAEELDIKPFESDMRHLMNTYIKADPADPLGDIDKYSLVEMIIQTGINDAIAKNLNEKGKKVTP